MIGAAKQQCLDPEGRYVWQRKELHLDMSAGVLQIRDADTVNDLNTANMALAGANAAKEWSFSSPIIGYGFDIIWSTGRVTSFLVDDEGACMNWVSCINIAIQNTKDGPTALKDQAQSYNPSTNTNITASRITASSEYPAPKPPTASSVASTSAIQPITSSDLSFTRLASNVNFDSILQRDLPSTLQDPPMGFGKNERKGDLLDEPIRLPPMHPSTFSSTLNFKSRYADFGTDPVQLEGPASKDPSTDSGRSAYIDSMRSIFASTKQRLQETDTELGPATMDPMRQSMSGTQALRQSFEREQEASKVEQLTKEVEFLRSREKLVAEVSAKEIEARVLRASNENSSYFEASVRALRLQHQREMQTLQEELAQERERATKVVEKETQQRKRAEEAEEEARKEAQTCYDRIATLEVEVKRLSDTAHVEHKAWQRERSKLVAEYESQVASLQRERDGGVDEVRRQFAARAQELQVKYESSLSTLRGQEADILRQQWESEKNRLMIEFHKQGQRDLELVRSEERKLAASEIENLRKAFQTRERQTGCDLVELEKLHGARVQQLEDEVARERSRSQQAKEDLAAATLQLERVKQSVEYQTGDWKQRIQDYVLKTDQLERELEHAMRTIEEQRKSEQSHREQAQQVIADARLLHAEVGELKRQGSEQAHAATQWRKVVTGQETAVAAAEQQARIAREEVQLLELEVQRLRHERNDLQAALAKAERLIFGVPQSAPPRQSYPVVVAGSPATREAGAYSFATGLGTQLPAPYVHAHTNAYTLPPSTPLAANASSLSRSRMSRA